MDESVPRDLPCKRPRCTTSPYPSEDEQPLAPGLCPRHAHKDLGTRAWELIRQAVARKLLPDLKQERQPCVNHPDKQAEQWLPADYRTPLEGLKPGCWSCVNKQKKYILPLSKPSRPLLPETLCQQVEQYDVLTIEQAIFYLQERGDGTFTKAEVIKKIRDLELPGIHTPAWVTKYKTGPKVWRFDKLAHEKGWPVSDLNKLHETWEKQMAEAAEKKRVREEKAAKKAKRDAKKKKD